MALLQAAPRFHSTMEILNRPPRTGMVHGLPGLLDALHRQSTQQDPFQGFLLLTQDTSILGRSRQEEGSHLATALQKGNHIGITVCHLDRHPSRWRRTHLLHRSRPHLAFPWPLSSLSAALFAAIGLARSGVAHPGFLMQQSEHALTAASGDHRQHRMHEEAAMAAIANGP